MTIKLTKTDPTPAVPTPPEGEVRMFRNHEGAIKVKESDGTVREPTDDELRLVAAVAQLW